MCSHNDLMVEDPSQLSVIVPPTRVHACKPHSLQIKHDTVLWDPPFGPTLSQRQLTESGARYAAGLYGRNIVNVTVLVAPLNLPPSQHKL